MFTKKKINPLVIPVAVLIIVSLACGSSTTTTQPAAKSVTEKETNTTRPIIEQIQNTVTSKSTNTPKPTNTPLPPKPTENPYLFHPGTYLVGSEIQPGIYKGNAGDSVFDSCYWERLKNLSGSFDAILANDNSVGQFYIEILDNDYAIQLDCDLVLLDSLPTPTGEFLTTIKPGMYLVGRDIQPGLYKGQAGNDTSASCYWERLRNVSGGFNGIITNENSVGQFYIQVAESDFALSTDCELVYSGN
jgi:hypothetical protein